MRMRILLSALVFILVSGFAYGEGEPVPDFLYGQTRVDDIAVSGDGSLLATAESGGVVRLLDPNTGEVFHYFSQGQSDLPSSVSFSPDGSKLLITWSKTLVIRDTDTGVILNSLTPEDYIFTTATFSPDGQSIAAGIGKTPPEIRIFGATLESYTTLITDLRGHAAEIKYSPDGSKIIAGTGGADRTVLVWDVATEELLHEISFGSYGVLEVAFSPDGLKFAAAESRGTIMVWNMADGSAVNSYSVTGSPPFGLTFTSDGLSLGARGTPNKYQFWDVSSGAQTDSVTLPTSTSVFVRSSTLLPDGKMVLGSSHNSLYFLNIDTMELEKEIAGLGDVTEMLFTPDRKGLIAISGSQSIGMWDVGTGINVRNFEAVGPWGGFITINLSSDGTILLAGTSQGYVFIFDFASGEELGNFIAADRRYINSVAISPDLTTILTTVAEPRFDDFNRPYSTPVARLWDASTFEHLSTFEPTTTRQMPRTIYSSDATFSLDGAKALVAYPFGLQQFDIATEANEGDIPGVESAYKLSYSPDRSLLTVGGNSIFILDSTTHELLNTLPGISTLYPYFSISENLDYISIYNTTLRIHDVATGTLLWDFGNLRGPTLLLPGTEGVFSAYRGYIAKWQLFGPLTQISELTATLEEDTVDLSWVEGDGIATVIFAKENPGFNDKPLPLHTQNYSPSDIYGEGDQIGDSGWFSVYAGHNLNTSVSGLLDGQAYRFVAYEYGVTVYEGDRQPFYLTTLAAENLVTVTLPPAENNGDETLASSRSSGCFIGALGF